LAAAMIFLYRLILMEQALMIWYSLALFLDITTKVKIPPFLPASQYFLCIKKC